MFKYLSCLIGGCFSVLSFGQENPNFSDTINLKEVLIIQSQKKSQYNKKNLGSIDEYLQNSSQINLIRRGSYAWEPMLNGMSSERSLITIDGMKIFGACTDKMDPITSYVERTNLKKAEIHSGNSAMGSSISGGINLVKNEIGFGKNDSFIDFFSGFESNNQQKILGLDLGYSQKKWFAQWNISYRDAEEFHAGNRKKVPYSSYNKFNSSGSFGVKIDSSKQLIASIIYDKATHIGYPALPMDVALAEAFIGSIAYEHHQINPNINHWETKFYFNTITHIMDDSQRPDVPIRMDMPGWNKTVGMYSKIDGQIGENLFKIQLNAHTNTAFAEMTMYSNDSSQPNMYMETWPKIQTNYSDIFLENHRKLNNKNSLIVNYALGVHQNIIKSGFGFSSLQIFNANLSKTKNRLLQRATLGWIYQADWMAASINGNFSQRAPSNSEAYGFYLFNSFDGYDYIGNPNLKNETSIAISADWSIKKPIWNLKLSGNYFKIKNFIIGENQGSLSPMTIGANGIRKYSQLKSAEISNASIDFSLQIHSKIHSNLSGSFRYGTSDKYSKLPQIQPFTYQWNIHFDHHYFNGVLSLEGAAKHERISEYFAEKPLPDYAILNTSISKDIKIKSTNLNIQLGIENLFDTNYTTFSDWNRLPRMGRNCFLHLQYAIK